jgi:tyrosinase
MVDLGKLGYTYDDLSPAVPAAEPAARLLQLGASPATVKEVQGIAPVATGSDVELVGATGGPLQIAGNEARASVELDGGVLHKVSASLTAAVTGTTPDRVFLNLENVRGLAGSTAFDVYVGLPSGANAVDHPELLAGTIGLFGVRKATLGDSAHAGQGLTFVLEITKIVDDLHLSKSLDIGTLGVLILPVNPVSDAARVSIGRISIYRQGG